MKKNGFVFVESIVVLMVVALSVAMLIASYSLVSRKTKEKENYDKASDRYLLYSISNLGASDNCNYATASTTIDECNKLNIEVNINNCESSKTGYLMKDCKKVFEDTNLKNLYVVQNVRNTLNDLDNEGNKITNGQSAVEKYTPGTIEYMKTLKKCNDLNEYYEDPETGKITYINKNKSTDICQNPITYMIGEFERGGEYYYASIELGEITLDSTSNSTSKKVGWVIEGSLYPINKQKWYFYDDNGVRLTGGPWYLTAHTPRIGNFDNNINGSGYYHVNGLNEYYFDEYGVMYTGWKKVGNEMKYFKNVDTDGAKGVDGGTVSGFVTMQDGKIYYFTSLQIPNITFGSIKTTVYTTDKCYVCPDDKYDASKCTEPCPDTLTGTEVIRSIIRNTDGKGVLFDNEGNCIEGTCNFYKKIN